MSSILQRVTMSWCQVESLGEERVVIRDWVVEERRARWVDNL